MSATTLNSAVNKACGANKQKFSLVFMHSDVATNLENMKLLEFMKQTDGDGIQKDLTLPLGMAALWLWTMIFPP